MNPIHQKADVGVIVGRFQVDKLHQGHKDLIDTVISLYPKVIIMLGMPALPGLHNNPLDFESRKHMLTSAYPNVIISYIKDHPFDSAWSKLLDEKIGDLITPSQSVVLHGSRDSFISRYSGKYPTQVWEQKHYYSGTEIRNAISRRALNSEDFRSGVIWSSYNSYPCAIPTVDIAVIKEDLSEVLVGRKSSAGYCFIGGFAHPDSERYEDDAHRELMEEAGDIEVSPPQYLCSAKINDWRYRGEKNQIKTLFFVSRFLHGSPKAGDDMPEIHWIPLSLKPEFVQSFAEEHRRLALALQAHINSISLKEHANANTRKH